MAVEVYGLRVVYEVYPRTDSQNVNKPFHLISATVKQS